jgi:hypothetical protein
MSPPRACFNSSPKCSPTNSRADVSSRASGSRAFEPPPARLARGQSGYPGVPVTNLWPGTGTASEFAEKLGGARLQPRSTGSESAETRWLMLSSAERMRKRRLQSRSGRTGSFSDLCSCAAKRRPMLRPPLEWRVADQRSASREATADREALAFSRAPPVLELEMPNPHRFAV